MAVHGHYCVKYALLSISICLIMMLYYGLYLFMNYDCYINCYIIGLICIWFSYESIDSLVNNGTGLLTRHGIILCRLAH